MFPPLLSHRPVFSYCFASVFERIEIGTQPLPATRRIVCCYPLVDFSSSSSLLPHQSSELASDGDRDERRALCEEGDIREGVAVLKETLSIGNQETQTMETCLTFTLSFDTSPLRLYNGAQCFFR